MKRTGMEQEKQGQLQGQPAEDCWPNVMDLLEVFQGILKTLQDHTKILEQIRDDAAPIGDL